MGRAKAVALYLALCILSRGRLCQYKSLVALGRDLLALLPVTTDTFRPQIGQEGARFAGNVGTHVPGVRADHQRRVDDLVDMRNPLLLRLGDRLDAGLAGLAHVVDA